MEKDMNMEILPTDRIIKINDFELCTTAEYCPYRRNINCYSATVEEYIKENNLSKEKIYDIIKVGEYLYENIDNINDLKLIKIMGYH